MSRVVISCSIIELDSIRLVFIVVMLWLIRIDGS